MPSPISRKRRRVAPGQASTTTSLTIRKDLHEWVADLAAARGVTNAVVFEDALEFYKSAVEQAASEKSVGPEATVSAHCESIVARNQPSTVADPFSSQVEL